jgi:hypothetical protein
MATDKDGHSKGFAFVEFEDEVRFLNTSLAADADIGFRNRLRLLWKRTTKSSKNAASQ